MHFSVLTGLTVAGLAFLVSAAPTDQRGVSAPVTHLPDGLPFPCPKQIKKIEEKAHGTLPNTPLPDHVSEEGIVNLKLIAFSELMEVAFFNQLLKNITNKVPGYEIGKEKDRDFAIETLRAILGVGALISCWRIPGG